MKFLRIEHDGEKKYLRCLGLRISYYTEGTGECRKAVIGGIPFTYWRDLEEDIPYVKLFGKQIAFRSSRRGKHYQLRDRLTDRKCKELLVKELTPLLGYRPDLDTPATFNEKINWLKLHNHDPRITTCCDKYAVKQYAAEKIGAEYVLPVLGVWEKAADVDFDSLPEQFALKVNWSSGYNIIVPDKSKLDVDEARKKLAKWMVPASNSYYDTFNWGYKHMKPVIYAEPYIEQIDGQVYDYKFYFSKGRFLYMFIATDRLGEKSLTYTFYDEQFRPLPFTYGHKPNANPVPEMPKNLDKMLELAKVLADDFPFVRVDFYEVGDREFYLGEMTFYSGGGTLPFDPVSWDQTLGDKIAL